MFNSSESQAGTVTIPDPIFTSRTTVILLVMAMAIMHFGMDGVRLDQVSSEKRTPHQVSSSSFISRLQCVSFLLFSDFRAISEVFSPAPATKAGLRWAESRDVEPGDVIPVNVMGEVYSLKPG